MSDDNLPPLPERLYNAIHEVLIHHRMSYTEGEDSEAFPLVDMLCPPGSRDIAKGHDEITLICDAIYNDNGVRAALAAQAAQPVAWNFDAFDDWWQKHGKHNAALMRQPNGVKELMQLAWDVARERAPK